MINVRICDIREMGIIKRGRLRSNFGTRADY